MLFNLEINLSIALCKDKPGLLALFASKKHYTSICVQTEIVKMFTSYFTFET